MSIRHQQQLLYGLSAIFTLAVVGVAYWSAAKLDSDAILNSRKSNQPNRLAAEAILNQPAIDASVVTRTLRGPMTEAPKRPASPSIKTPLSPPKKSIAQPKRPSGPKFKLVGTVIDSQSPVAILMDADGKTDAKGVGDPLNLTPKGVTIESIQAQQVTLRYLGKPTVLTMPKPSEAARNSQVSGPTPTKRSTGARGRGR